jgi:hypothetical protein
MKSGHACISKTRENCFFFFFFAAVQRVCTNLVAVVAHAAPAGENHGALRVSNSVTVSASQVREPNRRVLLVASHATSSAALRTV